MTRQFCDICGHAAHTGPLMHDHHLPASPRSIMLLAVFQGYRSAPTKEKVDLCRGCQLMILRELVDKLEAERKGEAK